ncbi:amino acid ABC transporter permease [Brucepastera parasyntrophica]|uniref:amino acid ABC transporter permease n=1 Tax=Brucepastera parasyntrophica TaxID=2880008 RepID=UPI00210CAC9C|nr:amino acid ABC transporter permease [Brucepastera parasyntrophica]ULQ60803.1 amino acid ABC transporter permease [Brucepastera parasyntrophica]
MGTVDILLRLVQSLGVTIRLTLISLFFATILGLIFCFMNISRNRVLKIISNAYLDIIRGTPLLVQAFFIYFGIPQALGIRFSPDMAGIITLSLNAGAYMAEIFRGGINAVSSGQMEAARSLGLPYGRAMIKVVLPQAVRIIIPSLVNQFIITLKDTSILSVIGIRELTQTGKLIIAVNFESFKVWAMVALMYLVIIKILSVLSKRIEKGLTYGKSRSKAAS